MDQPSDAPLPSQVDGQWTAPFVMASFNTRIVRRSNALTGHGYGHGRGLSQYGALGAAEQGLTWAEARRR